MAIIAPIGSSNYNVPTNGQRGWGTDVTTLLVRLAAVCNQVVTSQYILTADYQLKDVSGTYGLKTNFVKGIGSIASADGFIRMASPYANPGQGLSFPSGTPEGKSFTYLSWRNSTNTADLHLFPNNDNATIQFAGHTLVDTDSIQAVSNKTLDATNSVSGVAITAGTITNAQVSATAAIALTKLAATTASRLLVSDVSGFVSPSSVTSVEAGYLSGVTSAIQTQLDAKQTGNAPITPGTATKVTYDAKGLITSGTTLAATDIPTGVDAAKIGTGVVSNTEFGYLDGVTSSIQTQFTNLATTYQPLDGDLTAIAAFTGTGFAVRTGTNTWATRNISGASSKITVVNGDGVAGGTTIDVNEAAVNINNLFGTLNIAKGGTGSTSATGTGAVALATSPVITTPSLIAPSLGTPSSGVLTNATGLPLTTGVTGTLPIANGGTGATTQTAAFNALAPTTTKGDLITMDGTNDVRLPVGTDTFVLTADSTTATGIKWAAGGTGSGSGSGEKNYITLGGNNNTNWAVTGTMLVTTESTVTNLPDNATQTTGIKFLGGATSGSTAYRRFTLDQADYAKKLKVQLDQAYAGVANDYSVVIVSNTASAYNGTSTNLAVSPTASLSPGVGQVQKSFDTPNAAAPYIEVRIVSNVVSPAALYVNNFLVGPGVVGQMPVVTDDQLYVPAITGFGTVTTQGFYWRRVGSKLHISGRFLSGTPSAATASIPFPPNVTAAVQGYTNLYMVGKWASSNPNAAQVKQGVLQVTNGGTAITFGVDDTTSSATAPTVQAGNNIQVVSGTTVYIDGEVVIPIAEWAGSGTVNIGAGAQVEYLSSAQAWDAAGTTTQYTSSGSAITGSLTANRTKTLTTSAPIQVNDLHILEFRVPGTSVWIDSANSLYSFNSQNAAAFGGYVSGATGSNTVTVTFFQFASPGTTYGSTSGATNYAPAQYDAWRVRKVNASSPVGFGLATSTVSGSVSGGTVPGSTAATPIAAGFIGETLVSTTAGSNGVAGNAVANVNSLVLTSGKWMVYAKCTVALTGSAANTVVAVTLESSTSSGTFVNNDSTVVDTHGVGSLLDYVGGTKPMYFETTGTTINLNFRATAVNGTAPTAYTVSNRVLRAVRVG